MRNRFQAQGILLRQRASDLKRLDLDLPRGRRTEPISLAQNRLRTVSAMGFDPVVR